jgi:hypothetical protein
MSKIKNMIIGLCLLIFAGISVNAVAGTSASPQDQVNNQTAIVKAVNQSDSIEVGDVFTDAVIGSEISVDDYSAMLTNVRLQRLPVCPTCRATRCTTINYQTGEQRCKGFCRSRGRRFNCVSNRFRS